jgi:hypothetical protein
VRTLVDFDLRIARILAVAGEFEGARGQRFVLTNSLEQDCAEFFYDKSSLVPRFSRGRSMPFYLALDVCMET